MSPTVVERIVFGPDGFDMVTVDRRSDGSGFDDVCSLKFWEFDGNRSYVLNTRVRTPHAGFISAVSFAASPKHGKVVATASHDKKFKIWRPTDLKVGPSAVSKASSSSSKKSRRNKAADADQTRSVWDCASVGFYRDLVIRDAAFSADASLLAVAYHNTVTLWSPLDNMLQHTLPHPYAGDAAAAGGGNDDDGGGQKHGGGGGGGGSSSKGVKSVVFVGGHTCPLLAVATESDVLVWDLLTCNVLWTVRDVAPKLIACTGRGTTLSSSTAPASNGGGAVVPAATPSAMLAVHSAAAERVLIFDAASNVPVQSWAVPDGVTPTGLWFEDSNAAWMGQSRRGQPGGGASSTAAGGAASRQPNLLMASSNVQLYQLRPSSGASPGVQQGEAAVGAAEAQATTQQRPTSQFEKMFGTQRSGSTANGLAAAAAAAESSGTADVLGIDERAEAAYAAARMKFNSQPLIDGPTHLVTSMQSLMDTFLKQVGEAGDPAGDMVREHQVRSLREAISKEEQEAADAEEKREREEKAARAAEREERERQQAEADAEQKASTLKESDWQWSGDMEDNMIAWFRENEKIKAEGGFKDGDTSRWTQESIEEICKRYEDNFDCFADTRGGDAMDVDNEDDDWVYEPGMFMKQWQDIPEDMVAEAEAFSIARGLGDLVAMEREVRQQRKDAESQQQQQEQQQQQQQEQPTAAAASAKGNGSSKKKKKTKTKKTAKR